MVLGYCGGLAQRPQAKTGKKKGLYRAQKHRAHEILYSHSNCFLASMPKRTAATVEIKSSRVADLLLDSQLCFSLYATSLAMTKVYRPLLATLGLTYPQYIVMLALWEQDRLTVGALGERVALDSGTLVPMIRRLTALGLVNRSRSLTDDRSVVISLTTAGANLSNPARAVKDQVACATHCTDAQIQAHLRSLKKLRAALMSSTNISLMPSSKQTPSLAK